MVMPTNYLAHAMCQQYLDKQTGRLKKHFRHGNKEAWQEGSQNVDGGSVQVVAEGMQHWVWETTQFWSPRR